MTDLFETPEKMPDQLKAIFDKWADMGKDEFTYEELAELQAEVKTVGFTFDYYLDAIPFDLRPIN